MPTGKGGGKALVLKISTGGQVKMFWQNIEGMNWFKIWKLNISLKKMALSRDFLEENVKNNTLVIELAPKEFRQLTSQTEKTEIEQRVSELEGFQMLKLCLLQDCKPVYKEQLTTFGVLRWLEVDFEPFVTYEFDSSDEELAG